MVVEVIITIVHDSESICNGSGHGASSKSINSNRNRNTNSIPIMMSIIQ